MNKNTPTIDRIYTCDGANIAPPLTWTKPFPPETKSFALIMCDPDAPYPPYFHWVIQYLPPSIDIDKQINDETIKSLEKRKDIVIGYNSANKLGYYGPCPPKTNSKPHRYYINLYALSKSYKDTPPTNPPEEFLKNIKYDVIEKRTLFLQTYKR